MSGAGGSFPRALVRFVELFNRGDHWESHEVLEGPWREGRSSFYQGLILLASAFVHVGRGNAHGIDAQLRKTLEALEGIPDAYLGIDVAEVRRSARRGREVVEEVERREDDPPSWSALVLPPTLVLDAGRVRGDEPELAEDPTGGGAGASGL